eukprot:12558264-Ditylum_brightwellii.AAC.1
MHVPQESQLSNPTILYIDFWVARSVVGGGLELVGILSMGYPLQYRDCTALAILRLSSIMRALMVASCERKM